jgi:septum formation protein
MKVTAEVPLVLGSRSPRRREILAALGVPFEVRPADVDEAVGSKEPAAAYLPRICAAKLDAALAGLEGPRIALVADTSVLVDGDILGKPADVAEAARMIARLSGRSHEVWTRFAIGSAGAGTGGAGVLLHAETVETRVTFRRVERAAIERYAASGEGLDKAGGYAIQGAGCGLVSRIEGSYTNVVGLPACEVSAALERLGIFP